MDYELNNDCTEISITLSLTGYDSSKIPTVDVSGVWMGLGWGEDEEMDNHDFQTCMYVYDSAGTREFTFSDWVYHPAIQGSDVFNFAET